MTVKASWIIKCWNHILSSLGSTDRDLLTWSIYRPKRIPFRATVSGNAIVVESPSISTPRTINYSEFECVAKLYDAYKQRKPGVRSAMRDGCGLNSSYIITLIHELCEQ